VASNKLVLNISKTKSIVFGTNHSLSTRPQLNLVMNGVAVEHVETKLLDITLECKLSLSKHIDSMVVKTGRGLAVINICSAFLTPHSSFSYLDYCPVVWSNAARKDLVKLHLAQNKATRLALHCNPRADIQCIRKVFRPLDFFHILLRYCLILKRMKCFFPSLIYTQSPIITNHIFANV
jgi:hypothetical protein